MACRVWCAHGVRVLTELEDVIADLALWCYEVIMARIAPFTERQPGDRCESQEIGHNPGRDTPLHNDVLMERILRRITTTPQEEVVKKIAPLVDIRRHKVLDIRRRIAEGTYEVADRLDAVVERVLEATRCAWERPPGVSTCVTSLSCLAADRCTSRRPFRCVGGVSFCIWNEVRKAQ